MIGVCVSSSDLFYLALIPLSSSFVINKQSGNLSLHALAIENVYEASNPFCRSLFYLLSSNLHPWLATRPLAFHLFANAVIDLTAHYAFSLGRGGSLCSLRRLNTAPVIHSTELLFAARQKLRNSSSL